MKQIEILPDDVLLEIFDFYTITHPLDDDILSDEYKKTIETWQLLIYVCADVGEALFLDHHVA